MSTPGQRLTPQQFAAKWEQSRLKERAAAQEHFIDLCRMLGHPTPAEADPSGESFAFERSVQKGAPGSGGGKGFADVFYRGRFAWEYKGRHADFAAAYRQLQLYREDLENPPLLVVSDMDRYEIHTNFTGTVKTVYSFTNDELPEAGNLRVLRALFTDPRSLAPGRTPEGVTEEAAERFASLADGLRSRGEDPQAASHFLTRLLFCLFSEDVGLLPKGLFTRLVERSRRYPERFPEYAGQLFEAMAEGGEFWGEDVRHFNGGLFESTVAEDAGGEESVAASAAPRAALSLSREELGELLAAAKLDWGSVEPAIFGTLFERSLDPGRRAQLGAHYTSREDILALIDPVLMDPLRRRWQEIRAETDALLQKMSAQSGRAATNTLRKVEAELQGFAGEIRKTTVLDPACGSGNFLYTALKELMDLEKEVATYAARAGLSSFFSEVSPEQLHGLEISPYARELAQASIWIGYLQWMSDNGFGVPAEPILGSMTNVQEMDAILATDDAGQSAEPDWPEADVVVGNPPFLGSRRVRGVLGDDYAEVLGNVYAGKVEGSPDLVCYWFERARQLIHDQRLGRAGLIATQAIRNPANRGVLKNIKTTGDIFMAWGDRPWILEGASVRVSIIGFDDGSQQERVLDGESVEAISSRLAATVDLSSARRLRENEGLTYQGVVMRGSFDLSAETAQMMLSARGNPNGRPNADVIRRRRNARDITSRPSGGYAIDFGADTPIEKAAAYEMPFAHVTAHVYPQRQKIKQASSRDNWWLYERPRAEMRQALEGLARYIVTPRVAKHRIFAWLEADILPDTRLYVFPREDDYFFGILHSRVHERWALAMAPRHGVGNDPTYNSYDCFETFPLPWQAGEEPTENPHLQEVATAAHALTEQRDRWLHPEGLKESDLKKRTLTSLYNLKPPWLELAHAKLDRAVFVAYGWPEEPPELAEEEMLNRLLSLNQERVVAEADTLKH